jgi:hypothetical protein
LPLSEVTYNFTQKVDYSALAAYTVVGSVNFVGDAVVSNSIIRTVTNAGTDVLMTTTGTTTTVVRFYR